VLGAAVALAGLTRWPASAAPLSAWEKDGEPFLGSPRARLVLIEYASFTCPHCAQFHREVLPGLKQRYIDRGLVRLIYRPMLTAPPELSGALQATVDCAPATARFAVISAFMERQDEIFARFQAGGSLPVVAGISAAAGGPDQAGISACLARPGLVQPMLDSAEEARTRYGITATPGLVLNGRRIDAPATTGHTLASVGAVIDATLRGLAASPARARP
jgi:protein-disulfide isomerase